MKYYERLMGQFWQQWKKEYLSGLREFHRHNKSELQQSSIVQGDVVLIHDDTSRTRWKLAVVTELIPGRVGRVRSGHLRTANGKILVRHVEKLYPLEIREKPEYKANSENMEQSDNNLRPPQRKAAKEACEKLKELGKFEEKKTAKKLKSVLKDAPKYADELNIRCQFDQTLTTMTYENTTTEYQKPAPKLLTAFLANAIVNNLKKEVENQNWLGALTLLQYSDNGISPESTAIHYKWRNIPDILYSVNSNIRQQLLPTKVYKKVKLQQPNQAIKLWTFKPCQNYKEMYGVQPKRPAKHTFLVIFEI
ncbi:hypothetical protein AC249_AIPGENE4132 [Exaiptasia diaphana]|nr:hypothetical protein AC249_AIPGENE4132 [Exaiptasia diaphana]